MIYDGTFLQEEIKFAGETQEMSISPLDAKFAFYIADSIDRFASYQETRDWKIFSILLFDQDNFLEAELCRRSEH